MFQQYGQAGYAWDPKMATTPGPQVDLQHSPSLCLNLLPIVLPLEALQINWRARYLDLIALTKPLPKPASIHKNRENMHSAYLCPAVVHAPLT